MRVLVLSSKMVWPLWGGGEIRNFNLLKEASKHHEVYLLCFLRTPSDRQYFADVEPFCQKIYGVDLRRSLPKKIYDLSRTWVTSKPYMLHQYGSAEMNAALEEVIRTDKIDVVHAHFLHVGQYASLKNGAAFVYDAHNLEHVLWERMADNHTNPLLQHFCRNQSAKFVEWQQIVAEHSEKIVTLSDDDRQEYIRIAPSANVTTVPNAADIDFFHPMKVDIEENSLLYFGNFEWQPQEDAVLYFCRDIMPMIRKRVPKVKLYLVGRGPSPAVQKLQSEDVIVTGFVDDIREYIARAGVIVLPLRVGAGTKHRVFQTLAMKRPLVTSPVGAEGIDLEHGQSAMIADAPTDFADQVVALLGDQKLRERLGENGRALVENVYNWQRSYEHLEKVFQEAREAVR